MALPAGALKATLTVGAPIDIAGAVGTLVSLHVRPDVPAGLVWAATGTPIEPWSASPAVGESPVTSASLEVLADQPGVLTSITEAGAPAMGEIRGWPLVAIWVTRRSTGAPTRHVRHFNAPTAGETVDLDLLPADGVTVPATVTYAQTTNIGAGSETPLAHKATHATGGTDALTPADIGAQPAGSYVPTTRTVAGKALTGNITLTPADVGAAPALGADDNYVTDAEKARLSTSDTKTVNTLTAAASVTVSTAYAVNKLTMTQATTITPSLAAGSDPITSLHLSGAFAPTWAASIKWADGTAPAYASPALYVFLTVDGGTTWQGVQSGKAFA